jgi:hypothetical protein
MMGWIIGACVAGFVALGGLIALAVRDTRRINASLDEPFTGEAEPEYDPAPPQPEEPFYGFRR